MCIRLCPVKPFVRLRAVARRLGWPGAEPGHVPAAWYYYFLSCQLGSYDDTGVLNTPILQYIRAMWNTFPLIRRKVNILLEIRRERAWVSEERSG